MSSELKGAHEKYKKVHFARVTREEYARLREVAEEEFGWSTPDFDALRDSKPEDYYDENTEIQFDVTDEEYGVAKAVADKAGLSVEEYAKSASLRAVRLDEVLARAE